ncbi:hypothetical protein F443_08315, partial [Phytophthora nicotianae P1569]
CAAAGHRPDRGTARASLGSRGSAPRVFCAARRRAEDLDRQLTGAANAASPCVLFCQHKYDVIHHKLESTQTKLAERMTALQERLDNSDEREACRLRYRDLKL